MEGFLVYPAEGGAIVIGQNTSGEIESFCFTPERELPLFSILKGRITERDDTLGGFWVSVVHPKEFFLPFSQTPKGVKVGDLLTLQVVRESVENKPPRVGAFVRLPLCGCDVVFNKRGVSGEVGNRLKELKRYSDLYGIRLNVWEPERCLFSLKDFKNFVDFLKNLPPKAGVYLRWKCLYTELLRNCGGKVYNEKVDELKALFPFLEVDSGNLSTLKLLSKGLLTGKLLPLTGERVEFPHGYFFVYENPALVFLDVNGTIRGNELSLFAVEGFLRLLKIRQWGGLIAVDFPTKDRFTEKTLKGILKEKLFPYGCKVLGFTNGGLLEILCPKRVRTTLERIREKNNYLNCHWYRGDFFTLLVGEKVATFKGFLKGVKVNPLRKGLEEKLKKLIGLEFPIMYDWNVPPDGFELIP